MDTVIIGGKSHDIREMAEKIQNYSEMGVRIQPHSLALTSEPGFVHYFCIMERPQPKRNKHAQTPLPEEDDITA